MLNIKLNKFINFDNFFYKGIKLKWRGVLTFYFPFQYITIKYIYIFLLILLQFFSLLLLWVAFCGYHSESDKPKKVTPANFPILPFLLIFKSENDDIDKTATLHAQTSFW